MDIKIEQIQDQVLNLSNELVQNQIISKDAYLKRASKLEKEKGKTLAPYDNYYDETLILIVSSVVGAQIGVITANKLRGEDLRALLAIIVLNVLNVNTKGNYGCFRISNTVLVF